MTQAEKLWYYTSSYDVVQNLPKGSFMIVRFWGYGRKFLCELNLSELGLLCRKAIQC